MSIYRHLTLFVQHDPFGWSVFLDGLAFVKTTVWANVVWPGWFAAIFAQNDFNRLGFVLGAAAAGSSLRKFLFWFCHLLHFNGNNGFWLVCDDIDERMFWFANYLDDFFALEFFFNFGFVSD